MRYYEITETSKKFSGLTPRFVKRLQTARHEERECNGGGGACHLVSEWIQKEYGWTQVSGVYTSPDYKEPVVTGHYWNLLPDGSILDATADQLGEGNDIKVVSPNSPTYHRYRPEYSDDNDNISSSDEFIKMYFPHWDSKTLHSNGDDYDWGERLRKERGNDWAVTNPESHARYRAMQKKLYNFPRHASLQDAP